MSEVAEPADAERFVSSLARGLAVMRALDGDEGGITLAEAARRTDLPRAAARRALLTLASLGYVRQTGNRFALTSRVLDIAASFLRSLTFPNVAMPILERVAERARESCGAAILEGEEVVFVARTATQRIMSTTLHVGARLPAYATAVGRVIVAGGSAEDMEKFLRSVRIQRFTDQTVASRVELRRKIVDARERGYAIVDQELEDGLRSIAVPVRDYSGNAQAAINISTHANRVGNRDLITKYLPLLMEAAAEIEQELRARRPG